jgi:hypothetical protein
VIRKIKLFEFAGLVHDYRDEVDDDQDYEDSGLQGMGGLDGVARFPVQGTYNLISNE